MLQYSTIIDNTFNDFSFMINKLYFESCMCSTLADSLVDYNSRVLVQLLSQLRSSHFVLIREILSRLKRLE